MYSEQLYVRKKRGRLIFYRRGSILRPKVKGKLENIPLPAYKFPTGAKRRQTRLRRG